MSCRTWGGGRAEAVKEAQEIGIFGEHDHASLLGGLENFFVLGIAQAQSAERDGLHVKSSLATRPTGAKVARRAR